jgi:hypothetical protein
LLGLPLEAACVPEVKLASIPIHFVTGTGCETDGRLRRIFVLDLFVGSATPPNPLIESLKHSNLAEKSFCRE